MADRGAGTTALGIALAAFPFTALAGRAVAGRSTDRRGRVVTMRAGLLAALTAGVLLALPLPVAGLVAARIAHGLADALVYTAASAYVLDRVPVARRAQALALLGSGIWAGYALGPLVGAGLPLAGVGVVVVLAALVGLGLTVRLPEHRPGPSPHTGLRALLPAAWRCPASRSASATSGTPPSRASSSCTCRTAAAGARWR